MKRKNLLKLIISSILALFMMFAFVACSSYKKPSKEVNGSDGETGVVKTAPQNSDFSLNETAVFEDIKVTATEIKESKGTEYFKPESGKIFVGIKFTIENISDEDQNISSLLLFDSYADSVKLDYSFSASTAFSDGTIDGTVSAGKKLVGWYAVEVPKDWKKLELEVKSDWLSSSKATFVFKK